MFKQLITSPGNKPKTPMEDTDMPKTPIEDTNKLKTPMEDTDMPKTPMEDTNMPKTPIEDTDKAKTPMEDTDMPKTPMQDTDKPMTPMEALDKVQEIYATNFDKVPFEEGAEEYYYKLNQAEYYLVYEGIGGDKCYLFHLYEFVLDEPETGLGHTVTYGWYSVAIRTGEVISEVEQ